MPCDISWFFGAKSGSTPANTLIPVVALIITVIMGTVLMAQARQNTSTDIETLARQSAKEFASEISAISVVDQGVRYYSVSEKFVISIKGNSASVSYTNDKGEEGIYTFIHTANPETVVPATVTGTKRICISKKQVQPPGLGGCRAEITICKAGDPCCTIAPSSCVYAG